MKLFIFIVAYCVFINEGIAQTVPSQVYEYPHVQYTVKDGLSQSQVTTIFQDSKGFIWVGTKVGANRFDGLRFENYKTNPIYPKDYISSFDEDKYGNIWMAGRNGIYCYDGKTVKNHLPDSLQRKIKPNSLVVIQNQVFFTKIGRPFCLYSLKDGVLKKAEIQDSLLPKYAIANLFPVDTEKAIFNNALINNDAQKILFDVNKKKLLVEGRSIHYKSPHGDVFLLVENKDLYLLKEDALHFIQKLEFPTTVISFAFKDSIFVARDYESLYFVDLNSSITTEYESIGATFIQYTKGGHLWVGTEKGLLKFTSEAFFEYPENRGMIGNVWDFVEGKDESMWFTSHGKGLCYLKERKYHYPQNYQSFFPNEDSYRFYMGAIQSSSGAILFPYYKGILSHQKQEFTKIYNYKTEPVLNIYEDKDSTLYIATLGLGSVRKSGEVKHFGNEEGLDVDNLVYLTAITEDTTGILWLGSEWGLAKFDGTHFSNHYRNGDFNVGINCLLKDKKENIWFGSTGGLYFHDYQESLPRLIGGDQFKETIKFLEETDNGWLVIGCIDQLLLFDLNRFYKDQEIIFHSFTEEDGFTGIDCRWNGAFKDSKGHIWIATSDKVIKLLPENLSIDSPKPNVFFDKTSYISVADSQVVKRYNFEDQQPTINISTSDKNLEINFFSIEHKYPQKVKYQYRLIGNDDTWSSLYSSHYANYSSLKKGEYRFDVRACIDGVCSAPKSIQINVLPSRLLERTWFWVLLVALTLSLLCYSILMKLKHDRKERNNLKLQVDNMKLLTSISLNKVNPHFTFNFLSSISDMLRMKENKNAMTYLSLFADVVRPIFREQKNITHTLEQELAFTKNYLELEKVRLKEGFDTEIAISSDDLLYKQVPQTILQTFANNAVKHGITSIDRRGKIVIQIKQVHDYLIFLVTDNGIGLKQSLEQKEKKKRFLPEGNGLKIIDKILDYLNHKYQRNNAYSLEDLADKKPFESGTIAKIKIYAHLKEE